MTKLTAILLGIIFAQSAMLGIAAFQLQGNAELLSQSSDLHKQQAYENFKLKHGLPDDVTQDRFWNCGSLGGSSLSSNGDSWTFREWYCNDDGRRIDLEPVTGKYLDVIPMNNTVLIHYLYQPRSDYWKEDVNTEIEWYENLGYEASGDPVILKRLGSRNSYCNVAPEACMGVLYEIKMVRET